MRLRIEQDVFVVRQLAREAARLAGLETQDQTRVATALSEVARVMLGDGREAEVVFTIAANGVTALTVTVRNPIAGDAARLRPQLAQVGRLVDTMEVDDEKTGTV